MAKTREIPIYSLAYGYTKEIYKIKMKLPKSMKHDLGQELSLSAIKILEHVVLSNRSHMKLPHIINLILQIEIQWALLRLVYDLKGISIGEFKVLSERLSEMGKQAQAWLNWEKKRKKD